MKSIFQTVLVSLLAFSGAGLHAATEQESIDLLKSTADVPQKWAACQNLRTIGTAKAIPALAALLLDEKLSQAARHALEGLPYPEADAALREALGKASGMVEAGIIDSLGWRGEESAVPLLKPLVSDADAHIAVAAAAALGRIGGPEAVTALGSARDTGPAAVQLAAQESLLKCAERFSAANESTAATAIYHDLFNPKYSLPIRTAAWRGLAMTDADHRPGLIATALRGNDRPIQLVALKLLREVSDRQVIQACLKEWSGLPAVSQIAVLESHVQLGAEALPTVHLASQSPDPTVRVAAWRAMAQLNDTGSIPSLANTLVRSEPAERDAARETLARLHGRGAAEAIVAQIESAGPPEKAELLRVLGERDERVAVDVLLKNAAAGVPAVRLASLEALSRIAPLEAAEPLLNLAAGSKADSDRGPVLKALYEICEVNADKDATAARVLGAMRRLPATERRYLLPLLSELATPEALVMAENASREPDLETAKEATRVLGQWPNAAPTPKLIELARTSKDPTLQTLAMRGAIQVAGQEPDSTKRLDLLEQCLASATRADEKKQALGQIGQVPTPAALELALKNLNAPDLTDEASIAALSIAEKLAPTDQSLADETATKVLAEVKEGDIARRAWALKRKPNASGPFIREWLACGPYRQAGAVGAIAVFDIPFAPEKPEAKVEWKQVPRADHVNLGALFPGQENCAGYLRTRIIAPQACKGLLLVGSDDGVKAWLNGKVVHSNNIDRGEIPDQDIAPIALKQGPNDLMLKITQGGGGWSACARIVGPDFKPISELRAECPN